MILALDSPATCAAGSTCALNTACNFNFCYPSLEVVSPGSTFGLTVAEAGSTTAAGSTATLSSSPTSTSTSSPSNVPSSHTHSILGSGEIAGIAIKSFAGVVIVVLAILYFAKWRPEQKMNTQTEAMNKMLARNPSPVDSVSHQGSLDGDTVLELQPLGNNGGLPPRTGAFAPSSAGGTALTGRGRGNIDPALRTPIRNR